jgi:hypothetical protein
MMVLPTISTETTRPSLPQWVPIAAVLVVAASLTPFTWQYAQKIQQNQQKIAKNNTPTPEKAQIKEPYSTFADTLPKPPINLNAPQTQVIPPLPNLITPSAPLPIPKNTIPTELKTSTLPPLTIPYKTSTNPINANAIVPNQSANYHVNSSKTGIHSTKPKNVPYIKGNNPSSVYTLPPSIANIPNQSTAGISNTIPTPHSTGLRQDNIGIITPSQASSAKNQDDLVSRLRNAAKPTSGTQASNNKTLFDTAQIAEAREYLNKRWQPPTGLDQTLEYSVTLGVDGTIEKIEPLNPSAREYIDSSGIPEIGKPFVSSNKSGQSLRIRVVLSPDSKVQTFPETP